MSKTRKDKLNDITADSAFDAIVVGGGINGIGVFRELSLQGLRVLLVERNDYCSGCSAAPSRMIHGGLRYLENGELSLVRESLRERDALLANAPHLVRPLPTTVPIIGVFSGLWNSVTGFFGGGGKPGHRGAVPIKIGLTVYDWLTRKRRVMPGHAFRGRDETRAKWSKINPQVRFSATYFDAWISHPERLGIELIGDVEEMSPSSVALNYATLEWNGSGDLVVLDGTNERRLTVSAKVIVNATGAWVDETNTSLASEDASLERLVSGTKGSHLIIDNPALLEALKGHMLYFENTDGRICIAFPYLERVLVGSTDIRVEKAARVRCEDDERDYILTSISRLFPDIPTSLSEIVFSYSGIRPLPRSNQAFTGRISRGHFTKRIAGEPPQICMVGGKWTTFRAFAEQTCDEVLTEIGVERLRASHTLPIGGGQDFPAERADLARTFVEQFSVTQARAEHLVDHYGTHGADVQAHCADYADDRPLVENCAYTTGETDHLARREQVVHLADLVLRRTSLAITGQISDRVIDELLATVQPVLKWTDERADTERRSLAADLHDFHGVPQTRVTGETDRTKECA